MSDFDLRGDHTLVCGKKGMGKSNLVRHLLGEKGPKRHLIYDVCREHDDLRRYVPSNRRGEKATAELEKVTERMVLDPPAERRPKIFAVEELSRFCGPQSAPPEPVYEILDMNRHYDTGGGHGLGFVGVTRRPSQVHTDAVDLADRLIFFRLTGAADKRRLRDIHTGLGETVGSLDPYEFVVYEAGDFDVYGPVPEYDTTGKL